MHKVLRRQLRRAGLSPDVLPDSLEAWQTLLGRIGTAYEQNDQDRYLIERSLDLSSMEMQRLYDDLRAHSESQLTAEKDKLDAIINGLDDGFCVLSPDGRCSFVNPAGRALLPGPGPEVQPDVGPNDGLDDTDSVLRHLFIPDLNARTGLNNNLELLDYIAAGNSFRAFDGELIRPDGRRIPLDMLFYPIVQDEKITGIAVFFRDISERKQAELARLRMAQAVEASADAIFITDIDGVIEYTNPAFSKITGWPEDEVIGQTPAILKSEYTDPSTHELLWSTIKRGQVWSGQIQDSRLTADGSQETYWAQNTIAPIRMDGDHELIIGYVAVQRDITDRVLQDELKAADVESAALRAAFAGALQDNTRLRTRLEIALQETLATQRLGLGEYSLLCINPGEDAALEPGLDIEIGRGAGAYRKILPKPMPEQVRLLARHNCYFVPLGYSEHPLGWWMIEADLSEDKPFSPESVLDILADMIGVAVADDRARRHAENARKVAVEAAQAKSKFLANMSHEIRTPMNGVLGMLEMLTDTELDTEQREFVRTAHASADSLLTIINDILDFSKIEAGKLTIENIPFDARFITEDVATLFSARAQTKSLELAVFVSPEANTHVQGDPTRLRQILTNIIGNALKFTPRGEVIVRVNQRVDQDDGISRLRFEVSDTGIGIGEEQRKKLFAPFVQADGSTTREFGGTGLGLAISKQLVEIMGGSIWVDSEIGQGSTFAFEIPFPLQPDSAQEAHHVTLDGVHVLAVDDNTTNLSILSHYLSNWKTRHESAIGGLEAIERLRNAALAGDPFELVLLDMQMPGIDGLTVARYIKADPMLAETNLVMISSISQSQEELDKAGIAASLMKPVRQIDLLQTLLTVSGKDLDAPQQSKATASDGKPAESGIEGRRVLLVEDNVVNQKVARGMLRKLGLNTEIVSNGQEAIDVLRAKHYDLILMDCQMPVMDGFEATRAIRAEQLRPGIPIIAMTAHAMSGDRDKCIACGMDDYIAKPVKRETLKIMLTRWLEPGAG